MMTWLRRIAPPLLLLVLAPLTAEFLLGDFSVRRLPFLLLFLPQYGGGALLIRELAPVVVVVLAAGAIAVAFGALRPGAAAPVGSRWTPPVWLAGALSLALASAFELVRHLGQRAGAPAALSLLAMAACAVVGTVLVWRWSRGGAWGPAHLLALAAGTILTYGWVSTATFLGGRTNIGDAVGAVDRSWRSSPCSG